MNRLLKFIKVGKLNKISNTLSILKSSKNYTTKNKEDIKNKVLKHNIKTITMGFPDNYGKFIGKKYDPDYFLDKVLKNGSNCCNYILASDMDCDPIPDSRIASFHHGFGDFTMNPDINSFREINYINDNRQLILFSDLTQNKEKLEHAPRTLLRDSAKSLSDQGLEVEAQCSINFMLFNDKFKKNQHPNNMNFLNLQVHDELINKFRKSLKFSGINVESICGEDAPGQFRVNLDVTKDLVEFCDNIVLLKLVRKISFN